MMDGLITGENDERVGISVIDNNDIEHGIEMEFDGEVKYHNFNLDESPEGYPRKEEQTPNESAILHQVRRFARYHVHKERGYDTLPVIENESGIRRARDAIASLSEEKFEEDFEGLFRQVLGDLPTVDPPLEYHEFIDSDDFVAYLVDIYLDESGAIEALSDIHIRYYGDQRENKTVWNDDPFPDRKPDARLQVVEDFVPSLDVFQESLVYHLNCQIRDCYIGRGEQPPDEFKILGRGQHKLTRHYIHDDIEIYERYNDESADIPGYDLEFDYGFGELGKSAMKAAAAGGPEIDLSEIDESIMNPSGEGEPGFLDRIQDILDKSEESTDS